MALNLEPAPGQYDKGAEDRRNLSLEAADKRNVKIGGPYDKQSPDGTWWRLSIDNAGVATWTAL